MTTTQRMVQTSRDAKAYRFMARRHIQEGQRQPEVQGLIHRHQSPIGFVPWADHIGLCQSLITHTAAKPADQLEPGQALTLLFLKIFTDALAPPRFLDPALAESLHHTDLAPLKQTPPMALPCFRLFLPRGLIQLDTGSDVDVALIIDRYAIADLMEPDGDDKGPGLALLFPIATGETYFIDFLWKDPNSTRFSSDGIPWTPSLVKAARLCAHAVLVMAYMPELVAADPAHRNPGGKGFGGKDKELPAPTAPIWVGRNFQRQVQPARDRKPAGQAGKPVRAHWRQGHWRSVAFGLKRLKRRLRWIQPVFVNATTLTSPSKP
jgi:hypothetical protein